jgi:hypothetical protein
MGNSGMWTSLECLTVRHFLVAAGNEGVVAAVSILPDGTPILGVFDQPPVEH